ncbi:uncharacterized protein RHIMIDRAFT_259165 [Rhizopus microsporus ATCC 52813]|uniref:Uncharacterized protein n=1 Tax=Rhizopus microsporus ATCC 52813 TaxID=1340429 RepID=A0A2G4SP52_RHIZD|nr:uncharacterized protein RHIMIDRAFT_259165 [Rhizopus microsporus ATCC 52813]PHZ10544.1 hypothetical protein RHIMIDRAFT_259165 [Rhizopus microsporus ATCC 52813]
MLEEDNADIDIMELTVANTNMLNYYVSEQETSDSTIQMFSSIYAVTWAIQVPCI